MKNNIICAAIFCAVMGVSANAYAGEWKLFYESTQKYFDQNDKVQSYYLLEKHLEPSGKVSKETLSGVQLNQGFLDQGLSVICARIYEERSGGLFSQPDSANVYYVNLSKIKSIKSLGGTGKGDNRRYNSLYQLTDGTSIKGVNLAGMDVFACGIDNKNNIIIAPPIWTRFTLPINEGYECSYDESAVDMSRWPGVRIRDAFLATTWYGKMSIGFNYEADAGEVHTFDHSQDSLRARFQKCVQESSKMDELQKRYDAANELERKKWVERYALEEANKQRQRAEAQRALLAEAISMRERIAIGTRTNCGQVFDIKKPMIGVQTVVGMQYIDINTLWGPSAGCYFKNGVYVGTSNN